MKRLRSGVDYFESCDKTRLVIFPTFGKHSYSIPSPYGEALRVLDCLSDRRRGDGGDDADLQGLLGNVELSDFVNYLDDEGLLIDESCEMGLSDEARTRFCRQMAYFEQSSAFPDNVETLQLNLGKRSVAVVGCGGVGAPVAELLSTTGVGRILLIDDDVVELGNLGRQIAYSEQDIGVPKVSALAKRIGLINPQTSVTVMQERIDVENYARFLLESDFVVVGADTPMPELLYWLDDLVDKRGIAYICMSNCPPVFRVGPVFAQPGGMRYKAYHERLETKWRDAARYECYSNTAQASKVTTVWVCYAAAAISVGNIVQYLLTGNCALLGQAYLFDMESLSGWWGTG